MELSDTLVGLCYKLHAVERRKLLGGGYSFHSGNSMVLDSDPTLIRRAKSLHKQAPQPSLAFCKWVVAYDILQK